MCSNESLNAPQFMGMHECPVIDGKVMLTEQFRQHNSQLYYAEITWDGNKGYCFSSAPELLPAEIILHTPLVTQVQNGLLELPPGFLTKAGNVVYAIGAGNCFELYANGFPHEPMGDQIDLCIAQHFDAEMQQHIDEMQADLDELRERLQRSRGCVHDKSHVFHYPEKKGMKLSEKMFLGIAQMERL